MIPQPIDQVPLFLRLSEEERELVLPRLRRRQVSTNEIIFSVGRPSDALFVITNGWVKLEETAAGKSNTLANLGAGSLLGEVDTLLARPYSTTARSAANTQLLSLSRTDIEDLISQNPGIGLKFSATLGMRTPFLESYLVQQRLRNIELLSGLSEDDLRAIAKQLDFRSFTRGDVIVEADQPGEAVFIIEEGGVRLITDSSEGESFEEMQPGALFGHTALITGKPYPFNARAITDVSVWLLTRNAYHDLIRTRPAIKLAFSRALAEALGPGDQADAMDRMRTLALFSDVPTEALTAIASRLVLRHFPSGEIVYADGTPGDALYIVEAGDVKLFDSTFTDAQLLEKLRSGDSFGEMALLTGRTRAECARAASDATVWVLYKTDFDDLMVQYPEISASLGRAITEKLGSRESDFVERHLKRIQLFSPLASSELRQISKKVRGVRFRSGEVVCFAGQPAQNLYLIERGEVKLMGAGPRGEPVLLDILVPGETFGEQAIVQNSVYTATAQAIGEIELWTIAKNDFDAMLEALPTLAVTITRMMASKLSDSQRLTPPPSRRPNIPGGSRVMPRPATNPSGTQRIQRPPSGARPIPNPRPQPSQFGSGVRPRVPQQNPTPSNSGVTPRPPQKNQTQSNSTVTPRPNLQSNGSTVMPRLNPQGFGSGVMPRQANSPGFGSAVARRPAQDANGGASLNSRADFNGSTVMRRRPPTGNSLGSELGGWLAGLSLGAKFRMAALGSLVAWMFFITLPFTAFTAVTAVAGLGFSNPNAATGASKANATRAPGDNGGVEKVAKGEPTSTPLPKPTATRAPTRPAAIATRVPTVAPVAAAPAAPKATLPPIDWDSRIGSGSDPVQYPDLQNVRISAVQVASGQKFWRAVSVRWERSDDHTIYVKVQDENGKRVEGKKLHLIGEGSPAEYLSEKINDLVCDCNFNFPMFGDGYSVVIEDQYPSDTVAGMCMCGLPNVFAHKAHVNFRVTFQLTTMP
ncbi:MAG: cyclic nucleotide-binding domain-containing protein [Chloroflexi bacterium]|nr:cyclic nucleotide-binding domain-containing protein [Chloroflexota bacterium]